ncbi:MAG: cytochrome c-550 PedF [Thiolinea sp.]
MQGKLLLTRIGGALLLASTAQIWAHGDVTPQAIDITGLEPIKDSETVWLEKNPYTGNAKAIEIGKHAYAQNCARCHGIDAVSGGIAPDLRETMPLGEEGDVIFKERMVNGAVRNGVTYMPKFDGIVKQEGLWAIRAWMETVSVNAPATTAAPAAAAPATATSAASTAAPATTEPAAATSTAAAPAATTTPAAAASTPAATDPAKPATN